MTRFQKRGLLGTVAALATGMLMGTQAHAAAITPGDLVIYRVGDGSATLATTGTAVFLDEYTPTGTLVQSIAAPTSGATEMTAVGNATTEGIITPSQDGTMLTFSGYRAATGASSITAAANGRVVGSIDATGTLNTTNAVTTSTFGTGTVRSLTTTDGSLYYFGTSTNVFYAASATATSISSIDARNSRQVFLANNILYASNGSTSITAKVQSYGALPTGTTTPTAVASDALADAVNGISFLDEDPTIPGVDTLYSLDTVTGQLQKYTSNGTSWNLTGSVATSAANLVAVPGTAGAVNLYLTTTSALLSLTDSSGFGGTLTGTPTSIATATTNEAFRGIGTLPFPANPAVPEPASLATLAVGGLMMGLRRRRAN